MKIARFEPFPYVDLLHRDVRRSTPNTASDNWTPAVDVLEEKNGYLVRADVPGVNPTDIDVSMDAGILTISGVRHSEPRGEDVDIRRTERAAGRFSRRFTLPETVDTDGIRARCSNGILEVSIPKLPEIQPRRIEVEAA